MDVDKFWIEKYRPTELKDVVCSSTTREILESFVKNDEIPNIMLSGHAGIGKTSTAKILIKLLEAESIYKNCAEAGIDTVRNDITGFSRTKSFNGKKKIVLLDEIDGMPSIEAQRSLRNVMEEYASHCRFILTCNYKHRVIVPLQSRCQFIDIEPNIADVVKRCFYILKSEKIAVDDENKKHLIHLIKKYFPDIRKCINEIQKYSAKGSLTIPSLNTQDEFIAGLIKLILDKKIFQARKYIIENEVAFKNDYTGLMKGLFDSLYSGNYSLNEHRKKLWLASIGEYMYRSAFVLDQEINFYCLIIALSEINA